MSDPVNPGPTQDVCDVGDCKKHAVQQFVIDGVTVQRCDLHSVPAVDVGNGWIVNYPKPAKPEK